MSDIINRLEKLQKPSRKHLDPKIIAVLQSHDNPKVLVRDEALISSKRIIKPVNGAESLSVASNRQSIRRVRVFSSIDEDPLLHRLNTELLGGNDYPVLTAIFGAVGGLVSSGGGLIFTAAAAGINQSRTAHRVLARSGDEVWHVEEIGKEPERSPGKAVYVSAFFVVDPYRKQTPRKGWLIHEERHELSLN